MPKTEPYYAIVPPGLEHIAQDELQALSKERFKHLCITEVERGGISFTARRIEAMELHLHARTLHRILLRVASFRAKAFPKVFQKASKLSWDHYLTPNQHVIIKASAHRSRLMHTKRLQATLLSAVQKHVPVHLVSSSDSEAEDAQHIFVRMNDDLCTLSVDLSGALLHKRGYRQETGRAPLRETHAAALLRFAAWTPQQPLLDPMCGSGTFAIEAALIAQQTLHPETRPFAFEAWPDTRLDAWTTRRKSIPTTPAQTPRLFAHDRNEPVVASAMRNAARAQVDAWIAFKTQDATTLNPNDYPPSGLIVCNLPYGKRIGSLKSLRPVYEAFGRTLSTFHGWRALLLWTHPKLHDALCASLGSPSDTLQFQHGGTKVSGSLWEIA